MDQKEITNRFSYVSLRTGEQFFKLMAYLAQGTAEHIKAKHESRLSKGEQMSKPLWNMLKAISHTCSLPKVSLT